MKKTVKIAVVVATIAVISVGIVTATILLQPRNHPPRSSVDAGFLITSFEGVDFEVKTDKDTYIMGENITITAILRNNNDTHRTIYCNGFTDLLTKKRYTVFMFYVYADGYTEIWTDSSVPDNATAPVVLNWSSYDYNITINASSTLVTTHVWNQTYGPGPIKESPAEETGQQVPPGTYHVFVKLGINLERYYGSPFPYKNFGNIKTITIEPAAT